MQKFAALSPLTGQYEMFDSEEAAISAAVRTAWALYLAHTQGAPFAYVEVSGEGVETWTSADGSPRPSPAQIELEFQRFTDRAQSFAEAQQLPITSL